MINRFSYYVPDFKNKKLIFRSTSFKENERSRKELLRLKDKIIKGIPLTIEEGKFFYAGIRSSRLPEDGQITDYEECNDNHFRFTYLSYSHDLTGGGYYENVKNGTIYLRDPKEIQNDLIFLEKCYEKWKTDLENFSKSDRVMVFIKQEISEHIKVLQKQPEYYEMGLFRKSNKYLFAEKQIYLRAKWLKMSADEFFFYTAPEDLSIIVKGKEIRFDERSYVHITYRHYAKNFQGIERGKTYHDDKINHFKIHFYVLNILKKIFETELSPQINTPYNFLYNANLFEIYLIEESNIFVVSSFYKKPMADLTSFNIKRPIDNELTLLNKSN